MQIVVFLGLIAAILLIRYRSVGDAALDVFLPALLLVPSFYSMYIPHLPPLSFVGLAELPICGVLLIQYGRQWKFQRTDLWMLCFAGGAWFSEYLNTTTPNAGLVLCTVILSGVAPYIIGKLLLEQEGMRERFVRRIVVILFIISVLSVWEFRMGTNLFTKYLGMFFPGQLPWLMQIRGGFVRIAGPFTGAIMAGMVLLIGVLFSLWLGFVDKQNPRERRFLKIRQSTILTLGLLGGLFMTNSRGPWIGAVLGFLIAQIGRAKNMRIATVVTLLLLVVGGAYGYIKIERYTSVSIWEAKDIEQENAIYRRELLDNYKPVVEKGGTFGWGMIDWPRIPGQPSIDNEFLFLEITQGKWGYWAFILLSVEAGITVIRKVRHSTDRADIYFALCLGGSLAGLILSLTTVFMGAQSYPLFFLLVGWSQAFQWAPKTEVAYEFRRVFA